MWFMFIMISISLGLLYLAARKYNESKPKTTDRYAAIYMLIGFGFLSAMFIWMTLGAPGYTPNERHRTSDLNSISLKVRV